jgi:hypothetical protein
MLLHFDVNFTLPFPQNPGACFGPLDPWPDLLLLKFNLLINFLSTTLDYEVKQIQHFFNCIFILHNNKILII